MSKGRIVWTEEQLAAFEAKKKAIRAATPQPVKQPKYRNRKVEYNGMKFDSQKELDHWKKLELLQAAGYIEDLKIKPKWLLIPKQKREDGTTERACTYTADFSYLDSGRLVVVDVKSKATKTQQYINKRKLLLHLFGITIVEV